MRASRLLHAVTLAACACGAGCLDFVYASGDYTTTKQQIAATHADVIVRGRVVDEQGKPLPGVLHPAGESRGVFVIVGVREKMRFSMEGEGEGLRMQFVERAGWFGQQFEARVAHVKSATVFFTREGYEPAWVEVSVPPAEYGDKRAPVVVVDDVTVTLRRRAQPTPESAGVR